MLRNLLGFKKVDIFDLVNKRKGAKVGYLFVLSLLGVKIENREDPSYNTELDEVVVYKSAAKMMLFKCSKKIMIFYRL